MAYSSVINYNWTCGGYTGRVAEGGADFTLLSSSHDYSTILAKVEFVPGIYVSAHLGNN